jgi:transcriptional regulator with XRE-family HTH domain
MTGHEGDAMAGAIGRLCAACKATPLSAYNKGALCSPCEKEVFSAAYGPRRGMPAWIWGTAPMRRMLARLNLGAAMETFRLAAGMSQAEAGKITGWSQAVIGLIENGKRDTIYDVRNLLRAADAFEVPREMLLPVILGHPAVFADRRIACAEAGLGAKPGQRGTGYKPGEIMHIISGKLKARGFEVSERISGEEITEIAMINPENNGAGTVTVGYDGYVTWEWTADFTDRSGSEQVTERIVDLLCRGLEPGNGLRLVSGGAEQ